MLIRANARNLKREAADLLGNEFSRERYLQLRKEVLTGFVRDRYRHVSFDRRDHLTRIDRILGTCGVEGMLLDRHGNDRSGDCSLRDVRWDIQYCNAGATYAATILYVNGRLMIGDWGTIAERLS